MGWTQLFQNISSPMVDVIIPKLQQSNGWCLGMNK